MTYLIERLVELRRQLDHLRSLRPRITHPDDLAADLSLHNDVLFALLVVCRCVIDVAGELASRRGIRFQDFTEAISALARIEGFPPGLAGELAPLAGFRNVLVHEYVELNFTRVVAALDRLEPIDRFIAAVADLEAGPPSA